MIEKSGSYLILTDPDPGGPKTCTDRIPNTGVIPTLVFNNIFFNGQKIVQVVPGYPDPNPLFRRIWIRKKYLLFAFFLILRNTNTDVVFLEYFRRRKLKPRSTVVF
jgi:hypothetical protein